MVEALDRILPVEDEEISKPPPRRRSRSAGMKFRVGAKVTQLAKTRPASAVDMEAGGKAETPGGRARHRRGRHRRQRRGHGPGGAGREARPRPCGHRRPRRDQCARALRHRRRRRPAVAGAQGQPRGRALRRARSPASAAEPDRADPGLHLFDPADRLGGPDRGRGQGKADARSRSAASRSAPTARPSPRARPKASSRRCSTPRPAP